MYVAAGMRITCISDGTQTQMRLLEFSVDKFQIVTCPFKNFNLMALEEKYLVLSLQVLKYAHFFNHSSCFSHTCKEILPV